MYHEFDITSAIAPEAPRAAVKLQGVANVNAIYNSRSNSTEEFIMGAVADMGAADRNIMYANSTLNALSDRLATAGKVARAVNTAKSQGMEGFQSVEYLNPWEYAIEGKAGDFFSKIWQAIRTACRKIISMIANFIKWLGNVIASADTKAQIKDYRTYCSMGRKMPKEAGKIKISSLDWKVDGAGILKIATAAQAHYVKLFQGKDGDVKALEAISATDIAKSQGSTNFFAPIARIFNCEGTFNGVKNHVAKLKAKIDEDLKEGITSVFKASNGTTNAKALVLGATTKTGKTTALTVAEIEKLSKNFSILDEGTFSKQIKGCVSAVAQAQKEFTKFTKTIDKLADKFSKVDKSGETASLSKLISELSNSRIRASSYYTGLMLEIQSVALRFCRTSHIALKQVIKAAKPAKAKATESYNYGQSVESLFNFN